MGVRSVLTLMGQTLRAEPPASYFGSLDWHPRVSPALLGWGMTHGRQHEV